MNKPTTIEDRLPHMPKNIESIHDAIHIMFNKVYLSPETNNPDEVPVNLVDETLATIEQLVLERVIGDDSETPNVMIAMEHEKQRQALKKLMKG